MKSLELTDPYKICQICGFEGSVGTHLKGHNITGKDYFDKYIRKSESPAICANDACDEELEFTKLSQGYPIYCSMSCRSSSEMSSRWEDEEFRSNKVEFAHEILNNKECKAKSARSYFINSSGDSVLGIFYIMIFDDCLKIGVCQYAGNLGHFYYRVTSLKPKEIHSKYIGNIQDVADLEYNIKLKFEPIKGNEYFELSLLDVILKEISLTPYEIHINN